MVPGSLTRSVATVPVARSGNVQAMRGRWHPANVPQTVSAQWQALLVRLAYVTAVGVVVALGHVWIRNQVVVAGYRLSATRQLVERLEQERRELQVRAAAPDAPGKLAELVRTRLGMRPPERGEEIVLP